MVSKPVVAGLVLALTTACGTTVQGAAGLPQAGSPDGIPPVATGAAPGGVTRSTTGGTAQAPPLGTPAVAAPTQGPLTAVPGTAGAVSSSAPISLGIPYVDAEASNAFVSSIGKGLATGDTKASMTLRLADLNAKGGILGRKVVPVWHEVDINSGPGQYEQAACSAFTQDRKVQYVMDMGMGAVFLGCMARAGVGVLSTGQSLLTGKGFARFPGFVMPDAIALDRVSRVQATRFEAMGFFGNHATTRVGVIYYDHPEFAAAEQVLEAELRARGITVAARRALHYVDETSDVGQTVSEASSAVLAFRSAGVTHVLAVEQNAWLTGGFGIAAASQEYYPRYGYTSQEPLGNVAANVPARALEGALFIGWNPTQDVADQSQLTPAGRACLRFYARTQAQETPNQRSTLLTACEALDFLRAALVAAGAADGARSLLAGAARLRSFPSAVTFRTAVSQTRPDGVVAARDGKWDPACSCFRYTGPPRPL
jgi:hypothetical protein